MQLLYSSLPYYEQKGGKKCSNRRQEIPPLKPPILNPIKKFMQQAYKQMPAVIFLHGFNMISTIVEKCGKNDLLCLFPMQL